MIKRNSFLIKYKKFLIIIILLLILWGLNYWGKKTLQIISFNIVRPFQNFLYIKTRKISDIFSAFKDISRLKKDNERLYEENWELISAKNQLENIKKENDLLRKELKILPRDKYELENAEVIAKSEEISDWILINKGYKQGIEKDQAVILGQGILLGKIGEVFKNSAKVVLISNSESAISAEDKNSGARGIARGTHGLGVYLDMVMPTEAIKESDEIITVASSKIPAGLLIGTITNVHLSSDNLVQQADIILPYDVNKIQFVAVIKK